MKNKLRQIIYDMRTQPVIAWVTLIATALSMFLIMVVMISKRVEVAPFPPESCRERLMIGAFLEITPDGSASIGNKMARRLYSDLEGVERVSFMQMNIHLSDIKGPEGVPFSARTRKADTEFWNIFDHKLLYGRYYTPEEADALAHVAVVSESTARKLFGSVEEALGQTFTLDFNRYSVIGIIADNNPLAIYGSGEVFIPTSANDTSLDWNGWGGDVSAALLRKKGTAPDVVRRAVQARYAELDTELSAEGKATVYHNQPFDCEQLSCGIIGSNVTPDVESSRRSKWIVYILLLIVPAINLSTMLQSRMRRRMSEIGIRRAFGCTRGRVLSDILLENFILTLAGGMIGLVAAIIFAANCSQLYDTVANFGNGATPSLTTLISPTVIMATLCACTVLNLLCAIIPAWRAATVDPVKAINSK